VSGPGHGMSYFDELQPWDAEESGKNRNDNFHHGLESALEETAEDLKDNFLQLEVVRVYIVA
jgi:hypothetical protein